MTQLDQLKYFASRHDDMSVIGERHEVVESFGATNDPVLLKWYFRNLSTNSDNCQWTLDETIHSRSSACEVSVIFEALCLDIEYLDSSNWLRENFASILNSLSLRSSNELRLLFSKLDPAVQNLIVSVIKKCGDAKDDLGRAILDNK